MFKNNFFYKTSPVNASGSNISCLQTSFSKERRTPTFTKALPLDFKGILSPLFFLRNAFRTSKTNAVFYFLHIDPLGFSK